MGEPRPPLSKFTFVGRMLLLAHLLLGIGGSALFICDSIPSLPTGSYPLIVFVIPVGLVCFFSYLVLAWILERFGIRIYKS